MAVRVGDFPTGIFYKSSKILDVLVLGKMLLGASECLEMNEEIEGARRGYW